MAKTMDELASTSIVIEGRKYLPGVLVFADDRVEKSKAGLTERIQGY